MRYRILHVISGGSEYWYPIDIMYAHPWEAELCMLKHGLRGWVQGFRDDCDRTYFRDWYKVD